MIKLKDIKDKLDSICFDFEIEHTLQDPINPVSLDGFLYTLDKENDNVSYLHSVLEEHMQSEHGLTKDELKQVYTMLKERKLHPTGAFDKQGRFYLRDSELVDVRSPSARYPYSQMQAGRTAKYVKAMANKYKPGNMDEMLLLFKKG